MLPCLNIHGITSEKPYCTESTNQFKHDVQLLYTIPLKFVISADYEYQ